MNRSWRNERVFLLIASAVTGILVAVAWWHPTNACGVGSAMARAQATVPEPDRDRFYDADQLRVGIGTAAIDGWDSLGDAVIFDGLAWLRSTRTGSPSYYRLVRHRYFQSNFLVAVAVGREPRERFRVPSGTSVSALMATLSQRFPGGVLAAGPALFSRLDSIAIAVAATDARPVGDHAARYYTRPMESFTDAPAIVVLYAAQPSAMHPSVSSHLQQDLVAEPGSLQRAHALRLRAGAPRELARSRVGEHVESVGEALGVSVFSDGDLELFPIARLGACRPAETSAR